MSSDLSAVEYGILQTNRLLLKWFSNPLLGSACSVGLHNEVSPWLLLICNVDSAENKLSVSLTEIKSTTYIFNSHLRKFTRTRQLFTVWTQITVISLALMARLEIQFVSGVPILIWEGNEVKTSHTSQSSWFSPYLWFV